MADGPLAGLAVLEPVLADGTLAAYGPLHAAHADLLERAGETEAAVAAWGRAAQATPNAALREELRRRRRAAAEAPGNERPSEERPGAAPPGAKWPGAAPPGAERPGKEPPNRELPGEPGSGETSTEDF
jgi:hypothetical protein